MDEKRAAQNYMEAWNTIKSGNFFDENVNQTFQYMLHSLWKTGYKSAIKTDILKHIPVLQRQVQGLEKPPPYLYILITLKDEDINKLLQQIAIIDLVHTNASEESAYHILNLIETFSEQNIPIQHFVNAIIKNTKQTMNVHMVEAMAYMITMRAPEFMRNWLKHLLTFKDDTILKGFVQMHGRRGMLELTQVADPNRLAKMFK